MWNKIAAFMIIVTALSLLLTPIEAEARGGRGGGGRGGGGRSVGARGGGARGGAYRGGHRMNRTPTMSRASSRPAHRPAHRPQGRPQIQNRPSQGRIQQSRPTVQQRPSAANRADLRNQVNRYAQSRPGQGGNRQVLGEKRQDFASNRNNRISENRQLSDKVSQRLQESRPDSKHWFDRDFFDRHDIDIDYWQSGANWWRPAAWGTLAAWGSWNWASPYYYDDTGYSYSVLPAESTYTSPSIPTTSIPTQPAGTTETSTSTNEEWLPLGVFAVAKNAEAAAYTNRFIQLAINREGEIAGVLYNSTTDAAQDLTGMVVPTTQKAYWSLDNQSDSPIASTGIYNLTQDETPINVHFSDGSDQTWTLVRLQQEQ